MARPAFPRTRGEFRRAFPDEAACVAYLAQSRWPDGFRCPRCTGSAAFELPRRRLWQCKRCSHQTSVTAGTVLHRTRVPLTDWFEAAYLVSTLTPGISALQLRRQLGLGSYETAWTMLHRLRRAMLRPGRDRLSGSVEVDESYVGGPVAGKRGRGAAGKVLIIGAVEIRGTGSGRVRLEVIPSPSRSALENFLRANVTEGAVVHTDRWHAYRHVGDLGFDHRPEESGGERNPNGILPRIHRVFSNLKTWLTGTHHGVGKEHLAAYLHEFEFRFNRRQTPMAAFQTLLGLSGGPTPPARHNRLGHSESGR